MTTPTVSPIEVPTTTVVGVSGQFISGMSPDSDAHDVIPQLWERLMAQTSHAMNEAHWAVGVTSEVEGSPKMSYLAAIRLDDNGGQSDGLETMVIPGGSYLACEHVGPLDTMGRTTAWFYSEYLPSSGTAVRDGLHLEIYDERFDPESNDSIALICVPV